MPYDPGPRRKVKAAAMVAALRAARTTWDPAPSWAHVEAVLVTYSTADWRLLSVAAGHPDRMPSPDTRAQVLATVQALADADLAAAR